MRIVVRYKPVARPHGAVWPAVWLTLPHSEVAPEYWNVLDNGGVLGIGAHINSRNAETRWK